MRQPFVSLLNMSVTAEKIKWIECSLWVESTEQIQTNQDT